MIIKKILDIETLCVQKDFITYIKFDNQIFINGNHFSSKISTLPYMIGNKFIIYYNDEDNTTYSINTITNGILKLGEKSIYTNFLEDKSDNFIAVDVYFNNGIYSQRFVEINLITGNISQELSIDSGYNFVAKKGNFFLSRNKNTIVAKDNEELKWKYNIEEEGKWFNWYDKNWVVGKISNILGEHESVLWISLKNDLILGINIETGVVLHRFESPVSIRNEKIKASEEEELPLGRYAQLDAKNGKILIIDNTKIIEINIESSYPEKEVFDIKESMSVFGFRQSIEQSNWIFDDNYIYFYDNGEISQTLRVGIFDRKRRKVVSSTIIETESKGISLVKDFGIYQNDIYVLDFTSTLWKLSISELLAKCLVLK